MLSTRQLVEGLHEDAGPRPKVLVSQSASGYYGSRGDEKLDESSASGDDFLADLVVEWEAEANKAEELGRARGDHPHRRGALAEGGALEKMLPFFKLGIGGPVAGGDQYVPWIHTDDVTGALIAVLEDDSASGPVNVSAPSPATNKELSKALGSVLKRPAFAPVPGLAVKILYGEMAQIVITGQRMLPRRLEAAGLRVRSARARVGAALGHRQGLAATGPRQRRDAARIGRARSLGIGLTLHQAKRPRRTSSTTRTARRHCPPCWSRSARCRWSRRGSRRPADVRSPPASRDATSASIGAIARSARTARARRRRPRRSARCSAAARSAPLSSPARGLLLVLALDARHDQHASSRTARRPAREASSARGLVAPRLARRGPDAEPAPSLPIRPDAGPPVSRRRSAARRAPRPPSCPPLAEGQRPLDLPARVGLGRPDQPDQDRSPPGAAGRWPGPTFSP